MSNVRVIRVLCVDDHAFISDGLRTRFGSERDIEFVGWRDSAESLISAVEETHADVVLLDIEMPGPDPFDAVRELMGKHDDVRVIFLSAYVRDRFIDEALEAGAWGYVSKSDQPDSVIEAIRGVVRDEYVFGPEVLKRCQTSGGRRSGSKKTAPASKLDRLSPREIHVLRLIGKGLSRAEIAGTLHRSPKTIDNHRAAIMEKLDIHDQVGLARFAIREGLINV